MKGRTNRRWSLTNQRLFFDQLCKSLEIKELDDWYRVSKQEIVNLGGWGM
jgi:hypothetical protein